MESETIETQRYKRGDIGPDGRIYWKLVKGRHKWATTREQFETFKSQRQRHERFQSGPERVPRTIAARLLASARARALKQGGTVTIDMQWIMERLQVCCISGIPFELAARGRPDARAPSLDRIDAENPNYSPENTRVVLWQVNAALNRFSDRESLPILRALVHGLEDLTGEVLTGGDRGEHKNS